MIITITIGVFSLIILNFVLLYFSCNRTQRLRFNRRKDYIKNNKTVQIKTKATLINQ